jgi:hypothetical protein
MRTKWALLTALLCYAAAPAATCDPRDQLSPLNEPEWPLAQPGSTTSRARVEPNSMTQQSAQMTDATIVLTARLTADGRLVDSTNPVPSLPSTSTASESELQSRLLMVCLGFFLTVAGAAMLLLPRR